jgi:hypothetical protein
MSGVQVKYNRNYKQICNNETDIRNQTTTRLEQKIKQVVLGIKANLSILIT